LTFNSFPTLDFAGVTQLVAVEPGREYHLEARAKASGFETRSALKLEIVLPRDQVTLAETNTIAGTTDWMALTAMVRIPTTRASSCSACGAPAPRARGAISAARCGSTSDAAMSRTWSERLIEAGALVLLVFTPLAFGTTERWSEAAAELLVLGMALVYIVGPCATGRSESSCRRAGCPRRSFWPSRRSSSSRLVGRCARDAALSPEARAVAAFSARLLQHVSHREQIKRAI